MEVLHEFSLFVEIKRCFSKSYILYFDALFKCCFYFMFRVEEVLKLKLENFEFGMITSCGTPFCYVTLPFRKTSNAPTKYELHPQPKEPAVCAFTSLNNWIRYIVDELGLGLSDSAFIFPMIESDGTINPGRPMSYTAVSTALKKWCEYSGLTKKLPKNLDVVWSTHAFRRGAAQHRFMYATERWSLTRLKQWGGWSNKDHNDVVIKYVMEEVWDFENYFGDALSPVKEHFRGNTFMGDSPSGIYRNEDLANQLLKHMKLKQVTLELKQVTLVNPVLLL
jgi:hypothetical protein